MAKDAFQIYSIVMDINTSSFKQITLFSFTTGNKYLNLTRSWNTKYLHSFIRIKLTRIIKEAFFANNRILRFVSIIHQKERIFNHEFNVFLALFFLLPQKPLKKVKTFVL